VISFRKKHAIDPLVGRVRGGFLRFCRSESLTAPSSKQTGIEAAFTGKMLSGGDTGRNSKEATQ
jgi:hypothetical protein